MASRIWRVHHPAAGDHGGQPLALDGDEAHHVRSVLRLVPGDPLAVFDGKGQEWRGRLVECDARNVSVSLEARVEDPVEAPVEIVLYQALGRPEQMDWVVQKGTEIGVAVMRLFLSRRSRNYSLADARLRRWRRIAMESCKQCGRRRLPCIEAAEGLPAPDGPETLALLLDTGPEATPLAAFEPPRRVLLAVGPESGFDEDEMSDWVASGWRRAGLGPRVLRTETAGLAASAAILALWGDLGRPGAP